MLVDSVKLMESPEKVIMSAVWTECVDEIFGFFGHTFHFSTRFGFIELLSLKNWKVDHRIVDSRTTREFAGQMIQSGSEIVSDVTKQESNIGTDFRDVPQDKLRAIRFSVELGNTEISVRVDESCPLDVQISDVIFGPFDLKEWTTQI
jgi:hypothetical protein